MFRLKYMGPFTHPIDFWKGRFGVVGYKNNNKNECVIGLWDVDDVIKGFIKLSYHCVIYNSIDNYTITSLKNDKCVRGFCKYILDVIYTIYDIIITKPNIEKLKKLRDNLDIKITNSELNEKEGKQLFIAFMKRFLPAGDALVEAVVKQLPSPITAQKYRADILYDGPLDDECANGIRDCDKNGPLMIYISKMVPSDDSGRFMAFGRVFSGTIRSGQKVRIQGPEYEKGKMIDLFVNKNIQRLVVMMANKQESIDFIECGNTCGLVGIDQYLVKTGTISDNVNACNIKTMKFSVSPVVQTAIQPKNPSQITKVVESLKRLAKSDPCVICKIDDKTNELIIAATGELHMEICLKDLCYFMPGVEIIVSDPIVSFEESISEKSSMVCLAKSPNNHNRVYMTAEPLDPNLIKDIENKIITNTQDIKERARILIDKYGWEQSDARKVWMIGPEPNGTNILVDMTKAVQYMNEVKQSFITGFTEATTKGVLCKENVRGVRFNIVDCELHADTIHRGQGQMIPPVLRSIYATILCAKPIIYEPIYLIEIQAPNEMIGIIYSCLSQKRGHIVSEEPKLGTPLVIMKGYLPVIESFGFTSFLRSKTSGMAFPQMIFSHYDVVSGDIFENGSRPNIYVMDSRKRKDMKMELPNVNDYIDKL